MDTGSLPKPLEPLANVKDIPVQFNLSQWVFAAACFALCVCGHSEDPLASKECYASQQDQAGLPQWISWA
jgi:hypothetical protein